MSGMSKQLRDAFEEFESLPTVAPLHASKLRDAIEADEALLKQMNQSAKAGLVRSFALADPAGGPVGKVDVGAGVMSLPLGGLGENASVQTIAAALKIQEMALRFGSSSYTDKAGNGVQVSQGMVDNLLATMNSSPELADQISSAMRAQPEPHLKS